MRPTFRFVVVTALRDRLFASLLGLLVIAFAISAYLGGGAVIEAREMTVVYMAGAARAILVLGLIVFTAFHVERLYDTREIEAILSRAISREKFILSYWAGLGGIGLLFVIPMAAIIIVFGPSKAGAVYWTATVFLEALIVMAFALFASLTMERAIPSIFASVGFYGLARLAGFFAGITTHGKQGGMNQIANPIMDTIIYMMPRLDLAGQTHWLVYGLEDSKVLAIIGIQSVIYIPLLLLAAMFDLRRKHF